MNSLPFRQLKATPRNCVCKSQPSFCSTSAVPKMGNTYSIPPFSELWIGTKILPETSCRIVRCCLKSFLKILGSIWKPEIWPTARDFSPDEAIFPQEYFVYYKGKWCTAGGKDPLFGLVDGFQIGPKASPCLGRFSAVQFFGLVSSGASPGRMAS